MVSVAEAIQICKDKKDFIEILFDRKYTYEKLLERLGPVVLSVFERIYDNQKFKKN